LDLVQEFSSDLIYGAQQFGGSLLELISSSLESTISVAAFGPHQHSDCAH
jgi:hypothetical protein